MLRLANAKAFLTNSLKFCDEEIKVLYCIDEAKFFGEAVRRLTFSDKEAKVS